MRVVAAESVWGDIVRQVAGDRARVRSLVGSVRLDPHDYEPVPSDARAVAEADYVVEDGLGYDPWMARMIAAGGVRHRRILDVGRLLGLRAGANPHRWYFPHDVERVVRRVAADLGVLDPERRSAYEARARHFLAAGLDRFRDVLSSIRRRYAGTPIGASETLVEGIAQAAGLKILTPFAFTSAVSEGTEPPPQARAEAARQIERRAVRVFVEDVQNPTPDVRQLVVLARSRGLPVVGVTETLKGPSFQVWQTRQLERLASALEEGASR